MATIMRFGWFFVAISWLWLARCATDVQAPSLMQVNVSKSHIQDAALVDSEKESSTITAETTAKQDDDYYYGYDYDIYDILDYIDYYEYAGKGKGNLKRNFYYFVDDYVYAGKGKGKLKGLAYAAYADYRGYDYDIYDILAYIDYYEYRGWHMGRLNERASDFVDDYMYAGKGKGKLETIMGKPEAGSCDCSCHEGNYVFDDRGHGEPDCWIKDIGYDKPCCEAKPPACDCSCHGGNYVFDDRGHGEPDCWIKDIGYDKPCC